jgi:very-short-patch-repair endonuclease
MLKQWTAWNAARQQAEVFGLTSFVDALLRRELQPNEVSQRFNLAYARWWLPIAVDKSDALRAFQRFRHEDAIEDFRKLDDLARKAASPRALQAIYHDLPPADQVPRQSELGLLRHQMGLKRPSKSIREVISGMPESFGKLAPCLLMSPLSIAQYLPANQAQFDVVVFDEASQIATWDAIGAIARGKQTIIVGDPKQLPPTNFFGRADSDESNDELDDFEKDLESILDEAQASGLPTLQLNWHYRSRHESLIAFSNYNYYGNHLVTFPAAESEDRGVSLIHVEGGLYDRGKSRTNRAEAEAIVADAVSRMKRCLTKPENERLTYGVVTFNSQQQSLIQDLFDQALRNTPQLEWFFADERIEPTAVKNLENVQGDERDVMYFSITFGKDAAGKFPVDFGAINRDGGERRLNVAVTRARQALLVYATFLPDELRAERSSARGVHDLKAFLEYAHKGPSAIAARTEGSIGEMESPFEEAIAAALESRGWRLDPQVGISGFRIDLGVIHPDRPGAYLAGIECDGATYHRSAAARDRDKTRQQVLEDLGWKICRVWSTDWWYDPKTAVETVHAQLNTILEASREKQAEAITSTSPEESDYETVEEPTSLSVWEDDLLPPIDFSTAGQPIESDETLRPQLVAKQASEETAPVKYQLAELDDASEHQARFFDRDYSRTLRQMALAVVEVESPVRDDVVARRVARAHGFARTSARIKDRVLSLLPEVTTTEEDAGRFLWATETPATKVPFRHAAPDDERRSLDEIAMPELLGLVIGRPDLAGSEDPALALAREIGLARLARSARERLESALELASNYSS